MNSSEEGIGRHFVLSEISLMKTRALYESPRAVEKGPLPSIAFQGFHREEWRRKTFHDVEIVWAK
jgi:hypothetical protein